MPAKIVHPITNSFNKEAMACSLSDVRSFLASFDVSESLFSCYLDPRDPIWSPFPSWIHPLSFLCSSDSYCLQNLSFCCIISYPVFHLHPEAHSFRIVMLHTVFPHGWAVKLLVVIFSVFNSSRVCVPPGLAVVHPLACTPLCCYSFRFRCCSCPLSLLLFSQVPCRQCISFRHSGTVYAVCDPCLSAWSASVFFTD